MHHREPGLPGAAFAHPRAVCGLISDGLHVHPEMVGLAFRMLGPDRLCLVTDAIAATGMGRRVPSRYPHRVRRRRRPKAGERVYRRKRADHERRVYEHPGFHRLYHPRGRAYDLHLTGEAVGEGRRKGRLVPGYDADVTVLTPDSPWRGYGGVASWPTPEGG